ncbi:hypothetical protein [Rhodoblastus acidophilus]|uniref:hypothetical protein n=1 Tax=Rhodoblastus acidophilus TaxID=1074 RepID=UPI001304E785|nr:hypothetical protein [Rhodoblastus acidophilus]
MRRVSLVFEPRLRRQSDRQRLLNEATGRRERLGAIPPRVKQAFRLLRLQKSAGVCDLVLGGRADLFAGPRDFGGGDAPHAVDAAANGTQQSDDRPSARGSQSVVKVDDFVECGAMSVPVLAEAGRVLRQGAESPGQFLAFLHQGVAFGRKRVPFALQARELE